MDAKLSQFQFMTLNKGEHVVEYSSPISGLASELEDAGHSVSEVERSKGFFVDFLETLM